MASTQAQMTVTLVSITLQTAISVRSSRSVRLVFCAMMMGMGVKKHTADVLRRVKERAVSI